MSRHKPTTEAELWDAAYKNNVSIQDLLERQFAGNKTPLSKDEIIWMSKLARELACATQELENRAIGMRLPKIGE